MPKEFFPLRPETNPTIYAYITPDVASNEGLIKVGQTGRGAQTRVAEQAQTINVAYKILLEENAMREDGSAFSDKEVHRHLRAQGIRNPEGEWFECDLDTVKAAIHAVRTRQLNEENRSQSFGMRPEQIEAVEKASAYFRSQEAEQGDKAPHFLWNAKMRFGKTFASYKLAQEMGWQKVLVLTFKPAVQNAWEEDLMNHVDFEGWQFIKPSGLSYEEADRSKPFVCFGSFQDYLGRNKTTGGIKTKNEWVHATHWDGIILDEYHFGAWRENAKDLISEEEKGELKEDKDIEEFDEAIMPITTNAYLYLSGTPFRAIASGEFIEEQIFNWTYSDEQSAKEAWEGEDNPYRALPRMVLMTYQLPESIREIAMEGEFNEFDLNVFFKANGEGAFAEFEYKDEVQKWLDMIRGSFSETTVDNLKMGAKKPPLPFSHAPLLRVLNHTFWYLPNVASCHAMRKLLAEAQNTFYQDYQVIVAAGTKAGIGAAALPPVKGKMADPLHSKTITLSCGKLTTGVTVKPWTGIFMLRNAKSPETYFQAAFRVQSPWSIKNPDGDNPNEELVIKEECYVFDFAPNRALRQIADYSCRLNVDESNPEKKVEEFIRFLPVLAYDGSSMKQIDAAGILDIAMSGTSATLLAKRWESGLLVNVDDSTLERLMNNPEAMDALMSIEGFRSLNQDLETIINKSESVKKAKKEANDEEMTKKEKKELSDEEKEVKSLRKQVQEKLIKFATRIPVFMYLTDYRERSLKDVITQLEPGLFQKVTGLTVKDFELLVSLGVFNGPLMNDAVFKFKRYEDASLSYTSIDKHEGENVGGFDTTITAEEHQAMAVFENQAEYG
ncbi:MAG: GIY-YIG nuclease family protein [Akkermansiaceae bacterium]